MCVRIHARMKEYSPVACLIVIKHWYVCLLVLCRTAGAVGSRGTALAVYPSVYHTQRSKTGDVGAEIATDLAVSAARAPVSKKPKAAVTDAEATPSSAPARVASGKPKSNGKAKIVVEEEEVDEDSVPANPKRRMFKKRTASPKPTPADKKAKAQLKAKAKKARRDKSPSKGKFKPVYKGL